MDWTDLKGLRKAAAERKAWWLVCALLFLELVKDLFLHRVLQVLNDELDKGREPMLGFLQPGLTRIAEHMFVFSLSLAVLYCLIVVVVAQVRSKVPSEAAKRSVHIADTPVAMGAMRTFHTLTPIEQLALRMVYHTPGLTNIRAHLESIGIPGQYADNSALAVLRTHLIKVDAAGHVGPNPEIADTVNALIDSEGPPSSQIIKPFVMEVRSFLEKQTDEIRNDLKTVQADLTEKKAACELRWSWFSGHEKGLFLDRGRHRQ
jgi:hypothetical protein